MRLNLAPRTYSRSKWRCQVRDGFCLCNQWGWDRFRRCQQGAHAFVSDKPVLLHSIWQRLSNCRSPTFLPPCWVQMFIISNALTTISAENIFHSELVVSFQRAGPASCLFRFGTVADEHSCWSVAKYTIEAGFGTNMFPNFPGPLWGISAPRIRMLNKDYNTYSDSLSVWINAHRIPQLDGARFFGLGWDCSSQEEPPGPEESKC